MTVDEFRQSFSQSTPPSGISGALRAMWYDAQGDWKQAHTAAQDDGSADGAWAHAYLHRVEGDLANAAYWYRRANQPVTEVSLADEWQAIVQALLAR